MKQEQQEGQEEEREKERRQAGKTEVERRKVMLKATEACKLNTDQIRASSTRQRTAESETVETSEHHVSVSSHFSLTCRLKHEEALPNESFSLLQSADTPPLQLSDRTVLKYQYQQVTVQSW